MLQPPAVPQLCRSRASRAARASHSNTPPPQSPPAARAPLTPPSCRHTPIGSRPTAVPHRAAASSRATAVPNPCQSRAARPSHSTSGGSEGGGDKGGGDGGGGDGGDGGGSVNIALFLCRGSDGGRVAVLTSRAVVASSAPFTNMPTVSVAVPRLDVRDAGCVPCLSPPRVCQRAGGGRAPPPTHTQRHYF